MNRIFLLPLALAFALSFNFIACESKPATSSKDLFNPVYERGRTVYQTQCTACHNSDPRRAGSIGPEVFGSSRELLEARVLRAECPAGYKPKRETHQMAAFPHLKAEIDSLTTYLNKK
ncbi:MAG: c-type cytochrome [Bdellovibrionia bacterium]